MYMTIPTKQKLIPMLTASLLVLAGCSTQTTTNDNTNSVVNTNTANDNANEVVTNANENTNSDQENEVDEVDISDWNKFYFEELGISMLLPFEENDIVKLFQDCDPDSGCDKEGYAYSVLLKRESDNNVLISSVSKDYSPSREGQIYDVYDVKLSDGEVRIMKDEKNGFVINPIDEIIVSNKSIFLFDPILDYYTDNEMYNIDEMSPAFAAIIPLQVQKYKATIMYVEKKDMNIDELRTALKTIDFNN